MTYKPESQSMKNGCKNQFQKPYGKNTKMKSPYSKKNSLITQRPAKNSTQNLMKRTRLVSESYFRNGKTNDKYNIAALCEQLADRVNLDIVQKFFEKNLPLPERASETALEFGVSDRKVWYDIRLFQVELAKLNNWN